MGRSPEAFVRPVMNWIEPEFAALRYSALNGTDHRTHAGQGDAIAMYIRWRNARAQPKRGFAPGSVIRTWTSYKNKGAWRGTRAAPPPAAEVDGPVGEPVPAGFILVIRNWLREWS